MFINIISSFLFFLFIMLSLIGCGDEEPDNTRPRAGDSSGTTQGQSDGSGQPAPATPPPAPSDTTTPPPQNPYHVERYNKELKPNAPEPGSTKTTTCTKEGESNKVIIVYEYFLSQPPPPVAGTALMCDWLEDGKMQHFATVERDFCGKRAQERIDELKKEGYSCT